MLNFVKSILKSKPGLGFSLLVPNFFSNPLKISFLLFLFTPATSLLSRVTFKLQFLTLEALHPETFIEFTDSRYSFSILDST